MINISAIEKPSCALLFTFHCNIRTSNKVQRPVSGYWIRHLVHKVKKVRGDIAAVLPQRESF